METDGNIVASICLQRTAVAAIEAVGALDDAAIMRQHEAALVIDAEQARIAVMAGDKTLPPHLLDPVALDARRACNDRRADHVGEARIQAETARGRVIDGGGGMRCRRTAQWTKFRRAETVDAGIDDIALASGGHFKGETAGMGVPRCGDRRRQSGIGDDGGRTHGKPFVARIGRMGQRRSGGLVMPQNRNDAFRHGGADAVEKRKAAILMTEETQGGQHALDGFDQGFGRGFRAIGIGLAQWQKIGQQLQNRNGIA